MDGNDFWLLVELGSTYSKLKFTLNKTQEKRSYCLHLLLGGCNRYVIRILSDNWFFLSFSTSSHSRCVWIHAIVIVDVREIYVKYSQPLSYCHWQLTVRFITIYCHYAFFSFRLLVFDIVLQIVSRITWAF